LWYKGNTVMPIDTLLQSAKTAARRAGRVLLSYYESGDFGVETKKDNSPVTLADKDADEVIREVLQETDLPILSEERQVPDYDTRKHWKEFWMVDPMDGTRGFINKTDEFVVNIALIKDNRPIAGVVHAPVQSCMMVGREGRGVVKIKPEQTEKISGAELKTKTDRVTVSHRSMCEMTKKYIRGLGEVEIVHCGSAMKFMLIVDGQVDEYPRFVPTMEWDTAAPHALLRAIGGTLIDPETNNPLQYNKKSLENPSFIARL